MPAEAAGRVTRRAVRAPRLVTALVPIVSSVVGAGAGLAGGRLLPGHYVGRALILVEWSKVPLAHLVFKDEVGKRLTTVADEVRAPERLAPIAATLDPYPDLRGRASAAEVVERLRSDVNVRVLDGETFAIEYRHHDPEIAGRVAARLATDFVEEANRVRDVRLRAVLDALDAQVAEAGREMDARERALRAELAPATVGPSVGPAREQLEADLKRMGEQLAAARAGLATHEGAAAQSAPDPARGAVAGLRAELAGLRARLSALRSRYTVEHPDVRAVLAQIARVESELAAAGPQEDAHERPSAEVLARASQEIAGLEARCGEIRRRLAALPAASPDPSRQAREEQGGESERRKREHLEELRASLADKIALKPEAQCENFRLIEPARTPYALTRPHAGTLVMAGAGLGLAAGAALARFRPR
jgi:uncharacterized protein involved in exopolysaccharide biosynthesis